MNITTGFYQPDLTVQYENHDAGEKKEGEYFKLPGYSYVLFYQISGESEIVLNGEKRIIKASTLVTVPPNQLFLFKQHSDKKYEFYFIWVLESVFSKIEGDDSFLRAFFNKQTDEMIMHPEHFENSPLSVFLNSFLTCIFNHSGRIHVLSRLCTIISELDFLYDLQQKENEKQLNTDNFALNLIDYIERHCRERLTLKMLEEKFFVSSMTLNRICKNSINRTVYELLQIRRLNIADEMIKTQGNLSLIKIAELSGFNDYSAFYKAYKKRFGVPPSKKREGKQP